MVNSSDSRKQSCEQCLLESSRDVLGECALAGFGRTIKYLIRQTNLIGSLVSQARN